MEINLSLKHHAYIISLIPDRGRFDVIRYINQVATKMVGNDLNQMIKVEVTDQLTGDVYNWMGNVVEKLAASMNREIKTALLPQVVGRADLLAVIDQYTEKNALTVAGIVDAGISSLQSLK